MIDLTKYEPKSYADLFYGNLESKLRIEDLVMGYTPFPEYGKSGILLYGTWGTGKTTLAKILSEEIEYSKTGEQLAASYEFIKCQQGFTGPQVMTLVGNILSKISFNASGLHYIVLDEVDNLTSAAQKSLKSAMNTKSAIFLITTNYLQQIDKGVQDRCVLVEMNAASNQQMQMYVKNIAADMSVELTDEEIDSIISPAKGSMREVTHRAVVLTARKQRGLNVNAIRQDI
jgi:DNA polymerase III delta prime subunit